MMSKYFILLEFVIERTEENGGNLTFKDYASLELAFAQKVTECLRGYLQLPYHIVTGKKSVLFGLVDKYYPVYISLNSIFPICKFVRNNYTCVLLGK